MHEILLEMKHINKFYSGVQVLFDVDFKVRSGEIHALMGENGAGKSTVTKIITGVISADSGEMFYKGQPFLIRHPSEIYHYGIGIVHQEFNLLPDLTIAENIYIARETTSRLGLVKNQVLVQNAKMLMERMHLNLDVNTRIRDLSVAEQQLVEIAKALSYDCELLILDEPTSALAEQEAENLFGLLHMLRAKGVAIVYITHRMSDVHKLANRLTVLRDGHFIGEHKYEDINEDQLVNEIVGRKLDAYFPPRPPYKRGRKTLEVNGLNVPGVLHDISFHAFQGEILGIAGLMGAGRTELAHAIIGDIPHSSGQILIEGQPVCFPIPEKAVLAGIGYTTEDRKRDGLLMQQNIVANTLLSSYRRFCHCMGLVNEKKAAECVDHFISSLAIKTTGRDQKVSSLSGGNQQKVVLSRCLAAEAKILLLDEPTRGVDVGAKVEIYQLIYQLILKGVTVIVISSELPEILGICDRILVMSHGTLTADLKNENLTQELLFQYATQE